jgi:formate-dependent nitrite reductase cytochrome c552 subunit
MATTARDIAGIEIRRESPGLSASDSEEFLVESRSASHRAKGKFLLPLFMLFVLFVPRVVTAEPPTDTCENCHRNADFLVTNKKLYDYYQQWQGSVHAQEGVSCSDCHGGDALAAAKDEAHGEGVRASDPTTGIYFANVPETCGTCHDEILEGFRTSSHFAHVQKREAKDEQGPTCVTCHGSIDSAVLSANTVAQACERCHNAKTDNHPELPENARSALNRFLSIQRFYRYITVRAEPEEIKAFFGDIDPRIEQLSVTWHTFDLEKIDAETAAVLSEMKAKRDEIRTRAAKAK